MNTIEENLNNLTCYVHQAWDAVMSKLTEEKKLKYKTHNLLLLVYAINDISVAAPYSIPTKYENSYCFNTSFDYIRSALYPKSLNYVWAANIMKKCLTDIKFKELTSYTASFKGYLVLSSLELDGLIVGKRGMFENTNLDTVALDSLAVIQPNMFKKSKIKNCSFKGAQIIGNSSFAVCTNLESIKFEEAKIVITGHSFQNCTNLKDITFNKLEYFPGQGSGAKKADLTYNTYKKRNSDGRIFEGCTNLTSFTVTTNSLKNMRESFIGCSNLQYVDLSQCNELGGLQLFGNKTSIPSGVHVYLDWMDTEPIYKNFPFDKFAMKSGKVSIRVANSDTADKINDYIKKKNKSDKVEAYF